MHLVPSFSGRTRGPAGAFFAAAIRPERASFSRRAAGGCPNLAAPALPPSAEHGTGFGTTASFHCRAVLTQLPRDDKKYTMRQKSASARLPAFSRDGKLRPDFSALAPFPCSIFPAQELPRQRPAQRHPPRSHAEARALPADAPPGAPPRGSPRQPALWNLLKRLDEIPLIPSCSEASRARRSFVSQPPF